MPKEEVALRAQAESADFGCKADPEVCHIQKGATVLELDFQPGLGLVRYRKGRKFGLTGYEIGPKRELCHTKKDSTSHHSPSTDSD